MIEKEDTLIATITKSPLGHELKKPLKLEMPKPKSRIEEASQKFILETFVGRHPRLAKFCMEHKSAIRVSQHFLLHSQASRDTLYNCVYSTYDFVQWLNKSPDLILSECLDKNGVINPVSLANFEQSLEDYLVYLIAERGLARSTAYNLFRNAMYYFKINRLPLKLRYVFRKWNLYEYRAPTKEELQRVLDIATLREKVIICCLATGGFRLGTLSRLQYKHVKSDLERRIVPIHIHVSSEITKMKYHDYDTFLNFETADYIQAYIKARKEGLIHYSIRGDEPFPPESIEDDSPLICNEYFGRKGPTHLAPDYISFIVHNLFLKAGIISIKPSSNRVRYQVRPHGMRIFFRSHLALLGVERDFIEYMMGHKVSSYFDVNARGIEFLRSVYTKAGLSIRPQTKEDKIAALKAIAQSWEIDYNDILTEMKSEIDKS